MIAPQTWEIKVERKEPLWTVGSSPFTATVTIAVMESTHEMKEFQTVPELVLLQVREFELSVAVSTIPALLYFWRRLPLHLARGQFL